MKVSKDVANRMREMLTKDKIGIKEGFSTALENDVNNVLCDYFALDSKAKITVEQQENGAYFVKIEASASRIKQFQTTLDIPRF